MEQFIQGLLKIIHHSDMNYTSIKFYLMICVSMVIYYVFPKRLRWFILLITSGYFYFLITNDSKKIIIFAMSIIVSYFAGILIRKAKNKKIQKMVLGIGIVISTLPLIASKCGDFLTSSIIHRAMISWILPIGLSFYSMQIIAYLVDVYKGKIEPQNNILKYVLFISFFPIIIQGPISRYEQLRIQLYEGHSYDSERVMRGIQLIIWGLFLKYLIADKSAIIVNTVFDNYGNYSGLYILIAAILYSIQLYTDFLSCVTISQGVAGLFGIEVIDNFHHPYFSTSIKDFWRRWHISLSEWLRDYVYIPLGGNRKGKLRKYIYLVITFAVSGIWHGGRWKYLFWGLMHAAYQISGDLLYKPKNYILERIELSSGTKSRKVIEAVSTSFLVMIAWIIFRAETLKAGIKMIISMFSAWNPWILFDNSLFRLGLNQKECNVLFIAILILFVVSLLQEKGINIRDWFNRQNTVVRWVIYLCTIWSIWIFGTYGFGFNAVDFIYGGF